MQVCILADSGNSLLAKFVFCVDLNLCICQETLCMWMNGTVQWDIITIQWDIITIQWDMNAIQWDIIAIQWDKHTIHLDIVTLHNKYQLHRHPINSNHIATANISDIDYKWKMASSWQLSHHTQKRMSLVHSLYYIRQHSSAVYVGIIKCITVSWSNIVSD